MPLSHWASYCVMVAAVTNHDERYIMRRMPYARGLQYRTLYWLSVAKIEVEPIGAQQSSLQTIIR